jgi:hypothetical protein
MDNQKQQILPRAFPETTPFHLSHYSISVHSFTSARQASMRLAVDIDSPAFKGAGLPVPLCGDGGPRQC